VEARHGVTGYRNTQDAIESVSTMKSEFDSMKGRTLEDMSDMVQQFNSKIASKKAALEPIVRELRSVRQQAQVNTTTTTVWDSPWDRFHIHLLIIYLLVKYRE